MKNTIYIIALLTGLCIGCDDGPGSETQRSAIEQTELSEILHQSVFLTLYGRSAGEIVKTGNSFRYSIQGHRGGTAEIIKRKLHRIENNFPYYDDEYTVSLNQYSEGEYTIDGSYTFYTGQRYESISSPPTTDFIYTGGGKGGTLYVAGNSTQTIPVSVSLLNMLDTVSYHFNEVLVIDYGRGGSVSRQEVPMLAGLYRQTFKEALLALIHSGSRERVITVEGSRGGVAVLSIKKSVSGPYTTQTDTFSFKNYRDNDLVLNGTLSRRFKYNTRSGDIISGCSNEQYMKVTGLYETSVKHILLIDKPGSIWNFRMGYFVDRFYYETVSVRLGVGVGFK